MLISFDTSNVHGGCSRTWRVDEIPLETSSRNFPPLFSVLLVLNCDVLPSNQKLSLRVSPRSLQVRNVRNVVSNVQRTWKTSFCAEASPFAASFASFSLSGFSLPSRFLAPDNLQTDHRDLPYLLQNGYSSRSSLIPPPSRTNLFPRSRKLINFTFCQRFLNFPARASMKVRSS